MRNKFLQFGIAAILCLIQTSLLAQNADEIIYNQYKQSYYYIGGSFVIDSGRATVQTQQRAFLIWASNMKPDTINRNLALSEYGSSGNFIAEKSTTGHKYATAKTLFPKKVIKSKFGHNYYVLAYIIQSSHLLNGLTVFSTPIVYKIDGYTLNPIWSTRINVANVTKNNANTLIEYNDLIETKDGSVVIVGKYAKEYKQKEYVLATKLAGATGAIAWRYFYDFGNNCNEGANAAAETSDGNISIVGYATRCDTLSLNGPYDMLYLQVTSNGLPVGTFKRYPWQGKLNLWADNISRYYQSTAAGNDQLIISGYVDISTSTGATDRQILIVNIKQNGNIITFNHIGETKEDIARDLIFEPISGSSDYNLYLTGSTANYNSTINVFNEVFFLGLKFNAFNGVTGVKEMSVYPVFTTPFNNYSGRSGIEIKNAGKYQRFAILATGNYKLSNSTQTYTDLIVRDFADQQNACIKQYQPPFKSFSITPRANGFKYVNPGLVRYKEGWTKLGPLTVKQLCQQVKIDPYATLKTGGLTTSAEPVTNNASTAKAELAITPNPVQSTFTLSLSNKELLSGKQGGAVIHIYNASMQLVQSITVNQNTSNITVAADRLKPGMYIVQLVRNGNTMTGKFIKE